MDYSKETLQDMKKSLMATVASLFNENYKTCCEDWLDKDEVTRLKKQYTAKVELSNDMELSIDFGVPAENVGYAHCRIAVLNSRFTTAYNAAVMTAYETFYEENDMTIEDMEWFDEEVKISRCLLPCQEVKIVVNGRDSGETSFWNCNEWDGGATC